MKTHSLNLFIVDDNNFTKERLREFLLTRFGEGIRIFTFNNRSTFLEKVDDNTNIVVLNSHVTGEQSADVVKSIKMVNPDTEVIVMSGEEDIANAVKSYRAGAKGMVLEGHDSERRVAKLVTRIFMAPIRIIEKELGLSQRLAMFLMSFLTVGAIVLIALLLVNR
jgi:two-component system, NtrC family, response regulator AtoC